MSKKWEARITFSENPSIWSNCSPPYCASGGRRRAIRTAGARLFRGN